MTETQTAATPNHVLQGTVPPSRAPRIFSRDPSCDTRPAGRVQTLALGRIGPIFNHTQDGCFWEKSA